MKKFVFPLQRMLAFKQSLYEKERNELIRLRAARNELERRRDETRQQMLVMDEEFRQRAAAGVSYEQVTSQSFHRENADKLVKQLEAEMAKLDVEIEQQLRVVIQLDQDVKGLEKLREKQFAEYSAAAAKEEQERIAEMVSNKFIEEQRVES